MSAAVLQNLKVKESQKRRASEIVKLKVKPEQVIEFTEHWRDLIESGVTVIEVMRDYERGGSSKEMRTVAGLIANDLMNGRTITESLARFPTVFGPEFRSLIAAAESTASWTRRRTKNGEMKDGFLEKIVKYMKTIETARKDFTKNISYPMFIMSVGSILFVIITFVVLPRLKEFLGQLVPPERQRFMLKLMLSFSDMADKFWWLPLVLAPIGGLVAWSFCKSEMGKDLWMRMQLSNRFLQRVYVKFYLAEIFWLMGTLFGAGKTATQVLQTTREAVRNKYIAEALAEAEENLMAGDQFCEAVASCHPIFEGQPASILRSAEKSGRLDDRLCDFGEAQFEKVRDEIAKYTRLIEPTIIIVFGVIVGFVCITFWGALLESTNDLLQK